MITYCNMNFTNNGWLFENTEHALAAILSETRVQPCEECMYVMKEILFRALHEAKT